jgi:hypothetical protein
MQQTPEVGIPGTDLEVKIVLPVLFYPSLWPPASRPVCVLLCAPPNGEQHNYQAARQQTAPNMSEHRHSHRLRFVGLDMPASTCQDRASAPVRIKLTRIVVDHNSHFELERYIHSRPLAFPRIQGMLPASHAGLWSHKDSPVSPVIMVGLRGWLLGPAIMAGLGGLMLDRLADLDNGCRQPRGLAAKSPGEAKWETKAKQAKKGKAKKKAKKGKTTPGLVQR